MKHTIGYPCSPCEFIGSEEKKVSKVKMSCGGGVGVSKWYEYGEFENLDSNKLCKFTDAITGETKTINTSFVVKIESGTMVKTSFDTTGHANYHLKTCEKQTHIIYQFIPAGDDYEISQKYTSANDSVIKKIVERI